MKSSRLTELSELSCFREEIEEKENVRPCSAGNLTKFNLVTLGIDRDRIFSRDRDPTIAKIPGPVILGHGILLTSHFDL